MSELSPEHEIKILKRRLEQCRERWLNAANKALAGDDSDLRICVGLAEARDRKLVRSKALQE